MGSVRAERHHFLSSRLNETCPGEGREPESSLPKVFWTPAFAGVTSRGTSCQRTKFGVQVSSIDIAYRIWYVS